MTILKSFKAVYPEGEDLYNLTQPTMPWFDPAKEDFSTQPLLYLDRSHCQKEPLLVCSSLRKGVTSAEVLVWLREFQCIEATLVAEVLDEPEAPKGWAETDWTPYEETSLKQAPVPTQTVGSLSPKAFDVATWELEAYWKAKEGHRARHGVYPPNVFDFLSLHFRQDGTWSMVAPLCACPDGKRPAWEGFSPKQTYLEEETIHDIALAICVAHNLPAIVICGRPA